jgi:hypothetical protein
MSPRGLGRGFGYILLGEGYRELIFCNKIKCALRQSIIDRTKDTVLLRYQEVGREMRHLTLLHGDITRWRPGKELHLRIKLVPI